MENPGGSLKPVSSMSRNVMLRRPLESTLRPAVGVVDASWRGRRVAIATFSSCQRQPRIKTAGERVAYDPARPRIKHHCEIDEAFGNGDVTEIGDPKLIGSTSGICKP